MKTSRFGSLGLALGAFTMVTVPSFTNCARRGSAAIDVPAAAVVRQPSTASRMMSDDMILDRPTGYRAQAASGYAVYASRAWTRGTLPIEFRDSVPAARRALFNQACADWGRDGRVRCVAHTNEPSWVYVTNDAGLCYSYVGLGAAGARALNIGDDCDYRAILHEIGHALGLMHEHQRPDRDQFITVHPENALAANVSNFSLLSATEHASGYDFRSIMHYDAYAFSGNGQPTIVANPPYAQLQNVMGTEAVLSDGDRAIVNSLYPPTQVVGYLDAATRGDGAVTITGWACATGVAQSIPVHLYAGGAAGAGTFVTQAMADQPSEAGVANACTDFSGVPHRFAFTLTDDQAAKFAGQALFVHGIAPDGGANLLIDHSGGVFLPMVAGAAVNVAVHPIYRYYNGASTRHLFSLIENEVGAPWSAEGVAFRLLDAADGDRAPIYRCYVTGADDHFFSHDSACEGQTAEGLVGYSANAQVAGSTALYRCYRGGGAGHLMTTNPAECLNNGFAIEFGSAPMGWVF